MNRDWECERIPEISKWIDISLSLLPLFLFYLLAHFHNSIFLGGFIVGSLYSEGGTPHVQNPLKCVGLAVSNPFYPFGPPDI